MFHDERINRVCAGTYRTGILLAVLYTLLFSVCRALVAGFHVRMYLTEICIVLTGCMILIIGLIRWGFSRDERVEFERHGYYLTAGKVFVVTALLGYALSIPLRIRLTNDYSVNELILQLLTLGCVYFFCRFKRHEVSFNYTFIDEPASVYYRRVLRNIGKLAAVLLVPFGLAALLDLAIFGSFPHFLAILVGYVVSVLGLGLDYFLLSALEKSNGGADGENRGHGFRLGKGTFIASLLIVLLEVILGLIRVAYGVVMMFPLTDVAQMFPPATVGEVVASFTLAIQQFSIPLLFMTALAFCFLMEHALHSKAVRVGVCGVLAVQAIDMALRVVQTAAIVTLERFSNNPYVIRLYTEVLTYKSFAVWLAVMAFTCLLIRGLTRDCGVSPALWMIVGIEAVCQVVGLILAARDPMVLYQTTIALGQVAAAVLWPMVLGKAGRRGQASK